MSNWRYAEIADTVRHITLLQMLFYTWVAGMGRYRWQDTEGIMVIFTFIKVYELLNSQEIPWHPEGKIHDIHLDAKSNQSV